MQNPEADPLASDEEEEAGKGSSITQFLVLLLCYVGFLLLGSMMFSALQFEVHQTETMVDHPHWVALKGEEGFHWSVFRKLGEGWSLFCYACTVGMIVALKATSMFYKVS